MSHWWFRSATRVVGEKVRPVSQPYGSRQLGEQDTASLFERCSVAKRHAGPRQPCRIPAGFRPGPERFPSATQPRRPCREFQGRIPVQTPWMPVSVWLPVLAPASHDSCEPWGTSRYLRVAVLLDSGWDARREKMRGKCLLRRERLYRLRQAQHRFLPISWLLF